MEISITVNCPDIVKAAQIFANTLQDLRFRASFTSAQEPATAAGILPKEKENSTVQPTPAAPTEPAPQPDAPAQDPADSAEVYTLEQVRAALAKQPTDKARSIITSFGAAKLTAVDPKHYPAIMAKIKEAS